MRFLLNTKVRLSLRLFYTRIFFSILLLLTSFITFFLFLSLLDSTFSFLNSASYRRLFCKFAKSFSICAIYGCENIYVCVRTRIYVERKKCVPVVIIKSLSMESANGICMCVWHNRS